MKIAMIQMESRAYERSWNIDHAFSLLEEAADNAELLVLPELWTTGYGFRNLQEDAVQAGDPLLQRLADFARDRHVFLAAGSLAFREGRRVFNRSLLYDWEGSLLASYDKLHIFSLLSEPDYFSAGEHRTVAFADNVPIGLTTCYDVRFPELYRSLTLDGARLILVPSQWPEARKTAWHILNQARAIENQVYICAVNGVGSYKGNTFYGHSLFIGPGGEVLAEGSMEEEILYVTYSGVDVENVRRRMAVWADRRPDCYW